MSVAPSRGQLGENVAVGAQRYVPVVLGAIARRHLAIARRGRVLAVFRRVFYLQTDTGEVVGIGVHRLGPGPLYVLCELPPQSDWRRSGLMPAQPFAVARGVLRVGSGHEFDWSATPTWYPPPLLPRWSLAGLGRGLASLAEVSARMRGDGLLPLIPALAQAGHGMDAVGGDDSQPFLGRAVRGARSLLRWLRAALRVPGDSALAVPEPDAEVAGLIGLGPGLTPAGDDFLSGTLVALHALGRGEAAGHLAEWLLPIADAATGRISRAHLACACEGQAIAPLHEALDALCHGSSAEIRRCVQRLAAIGHSSGLDALAGLTCAAAAVRRAFTEP